MQCQMYAVEHMPISKKMKSISSSKPPKGSRIEQTMSLIAHKLFFHKHSLWQIRLKISTRGTGPRNGRSNLTYFNQGTCLLITLTEK